MPPYIALTDPSECKLLAPGLLRLTPIFLGGVPRPWLLSVLLLNGRERQSAHFDLAHLADIREKLVLPESVIVDRITPLIKVRQAMAPTISRRCRSSGSDCVRRPSCPV